jgi:hypothetical protein
MQDKQGRYLIARKACHRISFPSATRAAAARIITSPGIGIGTPIDLVSIRMKMAARPYWIRKTSIVFILPLLTDKENELSELTEKAKEGITVARTFKPEIKPNFHIGVYT